MKEIKSIVDDIGIEAFESNTNIAALAVVSDDGKLIYQTKNWDVANDLQSILDAVKGEKTIILSQSEYDIIETHPNGLIGKNSAGKGYIFILFFEGGILLSYALPQANPSVCFSFLSSKVESLNGKI